MNKQPDLFLNIKTLHLDFQWYPDSSEIREKQHLKFPLFAPLTLILNFELHV